MEALDLQDPAFNERFQNAWENRNKKQENKKPKDASETPVRIRCITHECPYIEELEQEGNEWKTVYEMQQDPQSLQFVPVTDRRGNPQPQLKMLLFKEVAVVREWQAEILEDNEQAIRMTWDEPEVVPTKKRKRKADQA